VNELRFFVFIACVSGWMCGGLRCEGWGGVMDVWRVLQAPGPPCQACATCWSGAVCCELRLHSCRWEAALSAAKPPIWRPSADPGRGGLQGGGCRLSGRSSATSSRHCLVPPVCGPGGWLICGASAACPLLPSRPLEKKSVTVHKIFGLPYWNAPFGGVYFTLDSSSLFSTFPHQFCCPSHSALGALSPTHDLR
jgi:hypothetical protein